MNGDSQNPAVAEASCSETFINIPGHVGVAHLCRHRVCHAEPMANTITKTARTHADGAALEWLQVRVSPEARQAIVDAAQESGVSMSYYVDQLIHRAINVDHRLPLVANPRAQRGEELPINTAA